MKKVLFRGIVLGMLIAAASFVRLWGIYQGGFAFTYDTGRDLLAVRDLVAGGKVSLIGPTSGQMGIFYGPWWYWFLTLPFIASQGNPVGIASFIAIIGVISVIFAYWWGIAWHDDVFGFLLAAIIAIGPTFISATTQIWSPDLLVPGTLMVLLLWSNIDRLRSWGLVLLGFAAALLMEMEIVYGVLFFAGFLIAVLFWQRHIFLSKKMLFLLAGSSIVHLPRVVFELRHDLLQTRALISFVGSGLGFSFHPDRIWLLLQSITSVLPGDSLEIHFLLLDVLLVLFAISWSKFSAEKRRFLTQCSVIIGVFWAFTFFSGRDMWPYYYLGLNVLFACFVAMGFSLIKDLISYPVAVMAFLPFVVLLSQPERLAATLTEGPFVGDAAVYRNQVEVIRYIYKEAGSDFDAIVYTPPQIDYSWRYLFWFMKKTYGWGVSDTRQDKLFVIIEPDPDYPYRLADWLAIRKNDGSFVGKKLFPSGIKVQTRRRLLTFRY
ncbi:hypothetical protein HY948_02900 [Candidatus Gottesmanbacteria bacterium]|nr:hypothetical protein [Candidatus Gottesmanbacteria bacterium]